jgi:gas vesicle protein
MSAEIIAAIIGAVIGGFLAACAGLIVEWRKGVARENNLSRLFSTAITDDLKNSILLYEKIQEDWSKSSLIWFVTINELRKSRQTYEKYNEHVLLFKSPELRQRISKYYLRSETLISTLETMQNRKYFIDNKYKQTLIDIKIREGSLADEVVKAKAEELMKNEATELQWINDSIPKSVNKLDSLITEAQNLLDKISETSRYYSYL